MLAPFLPAQSQPSAPAKQASTAPVASPAAQTAGAGDPQQLVQAQGRADSAVVDWVLAHSGPLCGDTRAGDFRVVFSITPAEGWWDKAGEGKLAWHEAPANSFHLRIFVLNSGDGRLAPNLSIRAALVDGNGNRQPAPVDFGWYPLVSAYGGNLPMVADGSYRLRVAIEQDTALALHPLHISDEHLLRTTVAQFAPITITRNGVMLEPMATAIAAENEATLLKPGIDALSAAIRALWLQAASGAEQRVGDYFIAYALSSSESGFHVKGLLPGKDSAQLVLLVRDSRTGRFLYGLAPKGDLIASNGTPLGPDELQPIWHPWLAPYGRNLRLPRKGLYRLLVGFDAPGFRRWGRRSERFASPAEIKFEKLSLKPEEIKPAAKDNSGDGTKDNSKPHP